MHAFKMAAKLQAIDVELDVDRPLILHTESQAGHGAGSSIEKTVDLWAKALAFRAHHTGLEIK
jgi:prolyl oligopeptidase